MVVAIICPFHLFLPNMGQISGGPIRKLCSQEAELIKHLTMRQCVSYSICFLWLESFSPVLVDLPRFKGLERGCIFHGATGRLTLHHCDDSFPLRLTRKCTHLPDLLQDSRHSLPHSLVNVCMYSADKYLLENTHCVTNAHITDFKANITYTPQK